MAREFVYKKIVSAKKYVETNIDYVCGNNPKDIIFELVDDFRHWEHTKGKNKEMLDAIRTVLYCGAWQEDTFGWRFFMPTTANCCYVGFISETKANKIKPFIYQ